MGNGLPKLVVKTCRVAFPKWEASILAMGIITLSKRLTTEGVRNKADVQVSNRGERQTALALLAL